jgi:DNA-binding NarL/FixJ family response regulator
MLTSTDLIRIVLVDDHMMLVDSLVSRFHRDTQIEVVGTATNADEGLSLILETEPDVVILDVELPGRGSFDIAEEISSRLKNTKMIFLTGYLSDIFIELALRVNAVGYLLKGEPTAFIDPCDQEGCPWGILLLSIGPGTSGLRS